MGELYGRVSDETQWVSRTMANYCNISGVVETNCGRAEQES